jgi:methyl-accepting chemotaxis protein
MAQGKRRINISRKILMIAASFSLPIAVLTYLMVVSINENITFASKETVGDAYQTALEDLLHHLQGHQVVLSTCPSTNPDCAERLAQEKTEVNEAFTRLTALNQLHSKTLELSDDGLKKHNHEHQQVDRVQSEWQAIVFSATVGTRVSVVLTNKYNHLLEDVRTMITHVGSTSNLILDPDLDSYYLMDVTLLALPQIQNRLGSVVISGASMFANAGGLTAGDRLQLAVAATMLEESDLARIVDSTQVALNEDANFYGISPSLRGGLEPPLEKVKSTTKTFIAMLRQASASEQSGVTLEAFAQAGMAAREASFQYWTSATKELDRLLAARIASYRNSRSLSLFLAALAVLLASLGAYVWMRSIVLPVRGLAENLDASEALLGKCVEDVYDAGQAGFRNTEDSMEICKRLNDHALKIRSAATELNLQVRGYVTEAQ